MAIIDIDVYGRKTLNGLTVHQEDKAISNAMVFFLTSNQGDFILNPEKGGLLKRILFKVINDETLETKASEVRDELKVEFGAVAEDIQVGLTFDNFTKAIEVEVYWTSLLTSEVNQVIFYSRTQVDTQIRKVNIPFEGDNLLTFVVMTKPSIPGILIYKNIETGLYEWDKYIFVNFSETSSNYNEIVSICNE